ncbi:MAG: hypothetical protein ACFFB3_17380 [Candidatus Hodarchaeota archaeon]
MKLDQLHSGKRIEFEFNLPSGLEKIIFCDFFDFDHRVIAKMEKVSIQQYATGRLRQMARFFGHLKNFRYIGGLRIPTEEFLNQFLSVLPFPQSIDLNETEIDENEFKLIMALMTLFPLEEPLQSLSVFVSSHINGDVVLVCVEVEPGIFICVSVLELPETSVLWESQFQWQPELLYCPQITTPALFS